MKFKLKMIAIATAMVSMAGTAQADLTTGTTQNNGSFSLLAFDTTTLNWYIRDLGYFINSFLPTGVTTSITDNNQGATVGATASGDRTPTAGLTIAGASAGISGATIQANFSDSSFNAWLTSQSAGGANVRWMVGAYDLQMNTLAPATGNSRRAIVSSTNAAETFLNSQIDAFVATAGYGGLSGFFNPGLSNLSNTGTGMNANAATGFNSGIDVASVGQSASLYYATRAPNGVAGNPATTNTRYGNGGAFATVTLEADGDFIYSLASSEVAAVPLPAAVWMMGAGLMALGGAARRRRAQAQA